MCHCPNLYSHYLGSAGKQEQKNQRSLGISGVPKGKMGRDYEKQNLLGRAGKDKLIPKQSLPVCLNSDPKASKSVCLDGPYLLLYEY